MRIMIESGDWAAVQESVEQLKGITVSNIKQLTNAQLNALQCGDRVIKVTGNQKHAYMVTYKGEGAGEGICMTYCDAGYMETVSYDRSGDGWVFNSVDVVNISDYSKKPISRTITVESTDWNDNVADVSVTGIKTTSIIYVSEDTASGRENYEAVRNAQIIPTCTSNGHLTLSAETAPDSDIVLSVVIYN